MRLFKRRTPPRRPAGRRAPSLRELRARLRTEQAETRLLDTEVRIHQEAARIRKDIRAS